jgi:uncharacterized RDD family membrane protein YckC
METQRIDKDLITLEPYYSRATWGKRLTNYLIDCLIFSLLYFVIVTSLGVLNPKTEVFFQQDKYGFITLLIYGLYMSLLEAIMKGKSFGKLITKTRAVRLEGDDISIMNAFARGFVRIVPFCTFSALGNPCNPWQDRWTKTIVIDEENPQLG